MAKHTHESNPSIKIPLDFILEDYEFNCRKVDGATEDYEDVEVLAKQIKADGQLSPVMVRKIPEDQKGDGPEVYELVFGFRRMAAIRSLGRDSIMAQIWDGSDEDMYFVNLAENVSRKNLKPWEKAQRYSELKRDLEISGAKIASRLGENKGHVNNLIRLYEEGDPRILKLWKDGHGKATTDALIKKVVKKGIDHDQQWENWLKHAGLIEEIETDETEEAPEDKPKKPSRPSAKHLECALDALKGCDEYSDEWIKGATSALRWALGKTKTLPKVYDPRKPAKVEETEDQE